MNTKIIDYINKLDLEAKDYKWEIRAVTEDEEGVQRAEFDSDISYIAIYCDDSWTPECDFYEPMWVADFEKSHFRTAIRCFRFLVRSEELKQQQLEEEEDEKII